MTVNDLSTVNALLNLASSVCLLRGFLKIKKEDREGHRKNMLAALGCSSLFLISYLIYHYYVGSVAFPYGGWIKALSLTILVPHIILAGTMAPFIATAVWFAAKAHFDAHRRLMRWVWPVWMYVSFSGVVVYLMLYHL